MPDWVVAVRASPDLWRLKVKLADPSRVMEKVGSLIVAQGRKSFREQRLGDVVWPVRYPKQKAPFLNLAPVVFKAGRGKKPTADDFRNTPALTGDGSLRDKLAYRVTSPTEVEAGHPEPWSGLFQWGGVGRIPITETTRSTLFEWLFGSGSGAGGSKPRGEKAAFASKLARVFKSDEWVQATYPRPFLGMTNQLFEDVHEAIARHLGATLGGGSSAKPEAT